MVAPARSRRATAPNTTSTWRGTFDLSQTGTPLADRTLRVSEGGHHTATQALNAAFLAVADLTRVTVVELCHAIRRMLAAVPAVRVRCDLDIFDDDNSSAGELTEFAFGPPGSRLVWVGDSAVALYRSTDDGETRAPVPSPLDDRCGAIEAIAVRPDRSQVLVGAVHRRRPRRRPAQFLFRTDDDGPAWPRGRPGRHGREPATASACGLLVFDPASPGSRLRRDRLRGVPEPPMAAPTGPPFNEGLPNGRRSSTSPSSPRRACCARACGGGACTSATSATGRRRTSGCTSARPRSTTARLSLPGARPAGDAARRRCGSTTSPDIKVLRRDPSAGVAARRCRVRRRARDDRRPRGRRPSSASRCTTAARSRRPTAKVALFWAPGRHRPAAAPARAPGPRSRAAPWRRARAFGDVDGDRRRRVHGTRQRSATTCVAPGYPRDDVFGASCRSRGRRPTSPACAAWLARRSPLTRRQARPRGPHRSTYSTSCGRRRKPATASATVVPVAVDESVVLRTTGPTGFTIAAVTPAAQNGANGAAPFGLAAVGAATSDVRFGTNGPYDLSAVRGGSGCARRRRSRPR